MSCSARGTAVVALIIATATAGAAPAPRPLFPPVQFEKLGLEDGLPQIHVTALAQDPRGFLWIGTQAGGLARYDGSRMTHYETDATPTSLSSQFITALSVDPKGRLWVGTGDAGLDLYDPATNRFTRYVHDEKAATSIASNTVTVLAQEKDGTLWIGFGSGAVDMFDPATNSFKHVVSAELAKGEISSIRIDETGQLWIASNPGGVLVIASPKTAPTPSWIPLNESISRNVSALLVDSAGTLWIGTEDAGLYELPKGAADAHQRMPVPGDRSTLSSEKITSLFEDRDHALWIGTQDGLNLLDAGRRQLTRYAPDAEYPMRTASYTQYVTTVFQDSAGIVWVGTLDFGVYKIDPLRREFHNYVATPEFGIPMAFCEAGDGKIWAGTYSHGLYGFDFGRNQYVPYPSLGEGDRRVVLTNWLTAVHCGRDGTLWIGGSGLGLVRFSPSTGDFEQFEADPDGVNGPATDRIEHILEGRDGKLYLATWGGGLNEFDPQTKKFRVLSNEKLLPSAYLHRLLFDVNDPKVLWIGAAQGGLTRFDLGSNTSKSFRGPQADATKATPAVLSNDSVLTLYQEPGGILWVGTDSGGLDRFDPNAGSATSFQKKDGLSSDVIYGILPDGTSNLWLTTSKGLVRFDTATKHMVTFTAADGLGSTEFNQNGYFRSSSGELFVSTLSGFNRFDPKRIAPDSFVPPVVITSFRLFGKELSLPRPIWETPQINLSYRDSVLTVELAALAYAAPKQTRFQYKLEGFRDEWLNTERGEITFTNLNHGDYVLKVKAANRHGVWNEQPAQLRIHIEPPIWRTKGAYALYVVLLVGAILLVVRYQRERVRRVEREGRLALVEQELQLTGAVQNGFLPDNNQIQAGPLQVVGFYKPADTCSGDWWWHADLGASRHLVIVGDVTGHGPGPAMVTAAVATAFHVYVSVSRDTIDIDDLLELLNREVLRVAKGKYQMTMAALEINSATGAWRLHSAGGPPMLTLDSNGKHRIHFCPGSFLGAEELEIGTLEGVLKPTERVLLYTDGIPEISMPDGQVMGLRRFAQLYEKTRPQTAPEAAAAIVKSAEDLRGKAEQLDDWTFALVEWGTSPNSPS